MSRQIPDGGPKSAMILAAGLGKRMRHLTNDRPKPMIEVAGRTLIDRTLDRLAEAGVERAVINLHYLADTLEAHLKARAGQPEILLSDERGELLDTGGGVKKALALLGEDAFFVLNSDMMWTEGGQGTLARMTDAWRPEAMDALMLMVPVARAAGYRGRGDFAVDDDGRLTRRGENSTAPYMYGSVQILHPRIFAGITESVFSLNRAWDQAQLAGRLFGIAHRGQWMHVDTPEAVKETEDLLALLDKKGQ
jgi:MurNAc alpha-1-phosphate uridylyltransferase